MQKKDNKTAGSENVVDSENNIEHSKYIKKLELQHLVLKKILNPESNMSATFNQADKEIPDTDNSLPINYQ
jgi:hypothetical protein